MKNKKTINLTENIESKVISAAYGDASFWDRVKVKLTVSNNESARTLFETHKKIAKEIKIMGEENCPQEIINTVNLKTKHLLKKDSINFLFDFYSIIYSRPFLSAATAMIIITAIVARLILTNPAEYQHNYSKEEIETANKQTRYALTFVGQVFKQTNTTLRDEVLNERISKPIQQSIEIVNDLFKEK